MTSVQLPETSWVSAGPGGLYAVRRRWLAGRHTGDTPALGSLCKIKVRRRAAGAHARPDEPELTTEVACDAEVASYPRTRDSALQVPLDEWVVLRVGEGQCDVTEACLEGMRAGEMCELELSAQDATPSNTWSDDGEGTCCFTLQLHSFTPGRESWEMRAGEKWTWVLWHKQKGGERFGQGDVWGAADCYCRAVKLAITVQAHTDDDEEEEEEEEDSQAPCEEDYTSVKADLHCNLSLCQLKLGHLDKSRESGIKATQTNPSHVKAWYRLGQACLQLGRLEEAQEAFGKVLELQPDSASARAALKEVHSRLKDLNCKLGQRLSKMFS